MLIFLGPLKHQQVDVILGLGRVRGVVMAVWTGVRIGPHSDLTRVPASLLPLSAIAIASSTKPRVLLQLGLELQKLCGVGLRFEHGEMGEGQAQADAEDEDRAALDSEDMADEEEAEGKGAKVSGVLAEEFAMGGPLNRVYWPPGREDWLRPPKQALKKGQLDSDEFC